MSSTSTSPAESATGDIRFSHMVTATFMKHLSLPL
jgi:hypothetical protein